jgi:hypothetical protein
MSSETEPLIVPGDQFSDEYLHRMEWCGGWEYRRTYQPAADKGLPEPPDGGRWVRNVEAEDQGQRSERWANGTAVTVTYWRRRRRD